jgi:hypothetical protein
MGALTNTQMQAHGKPKATALPELGVLPGGGSQSRDSSVSSAVSSRSKAFMAGKKPKAKAKAKAKPVPSEGGFLQPIAASVLMNVLYMARFARGELHKVVCRWHGSLLSGPKVVTACFTESYAT